MVDGPTQMSNAKEVLGEPAHATAEKTAQAELAPSKEERIWQVLANIPRGKVATYGQVAELAGLSRGARQVGRVLAALPTESRLPWHRVVNATGRSSLPDGAGRRQRQLLRDEGVSFRRGRIDFSRCRWQP